MKLKIKQKNVCLYVLPGSHFQPVTLQTLEGALSTQPCFLSHPWPIKWITFIQSFGTGFCLIFFSTHPFLKFCRDPSGKPILCIVLLTFLSGLLEFLKVKKKVGKQPQYLQTSQYSFSFLFHRTAGGENHQGIKILWRHSWDWRSLECPLCWKIGW
jgi:hypothetical protein